MTEHAADHRTDRRWVAIQRNRRSGAGRQYRAVIALIDELRRRAITPRLFARRDLLDAEIQKRGTDHLLGIVAAGGDGTVLDVLNRHPGIPVGILPLGTENLVARFLRIPRRDGRFVGRILDEGLTRTIDLGEITGSDGSRRFAIMASCGFDSDVLGRTHAARTGHITRGSYARPLLQSLRHYPFPPLRVTVDEAEPATSRMVIVANLPQYALNLPLVPTARPDDQQLDIRAFDHRSPFQLLRDFGNVLLHRQRVPSEVLATRGTIVRIESGEPLPVQADGDPVGMTPVTIRILPGAATLFVPRLVPHILSRRPH